MKVMILRLLTGPLCLLKRDCPSLAPIPIVLGATTREFSSFVFWSARMEDKRKLRQLLTNADFRYPLLFALKYLLTKTAIKAVPAASIDEIIGAYSLSGSIGDEDATHFIEVVQDNNQYEAAGRGVADNLRRQSRESLNVISQISYLHIRSGQVIVSLDPADAHTIFEDLTPILGPRANDREAEIRRLASLFEDGSTSDFFDYPNTIVTDVVESGFREGTKIKKTHLTIERNASLRKEFLAARPSAICDVCTLDTAKTYPWTERVMDTHHLLPLSSGTRVESSGTTFDDLVPVCPSCHRAIHRYYDGWLIKNNRKDFKDGREAMEVYEAVKTNFPGLIHA